MRKRVDERYSHLTAPEKGEGIDFTIGFPDGDKIPIQLMRDAYVQFFEEKKHRSDFFQYGVHSGYPKIRSLVAEFLNRCYQLAAKDGPKKEIEKENIVICGGVSFGLDRILTVLGVDKNAIVYCEELTFFCFLNMLRERGCEVRMIPFTKEGVMDLDWLETDLTSIDGDAAKPILVFTMPTFHNPTGVIMPLETRKQLVHLAHQFGFYIVSDEVYSTLPFSQIRNCIPPSLALLDDNANGRVMSLGSFSKVLCPALRFGWIHASSMLCGKLGSAGVVVSGSPACHLACGPMEILFRDHTIDKVAVQAANVLERKFSALWKALQQHLPKDCSLNPFDRRGHNMAPQGGYFMIIQTPLEMSAFKLSQFCNEKFNLKVMPASMCGDSRDDRLRLCFAYHKEEELIEGARRLGEAIRTLK
ncbi:2-aminoadipate transaminase-like isoform X2 [Symsagittifera roscoffensis]|uniref:2-aminoadipate transaminase-like isoform X2 n=1 Tax=Symsagittifera roscoffensis TaxID=84072 RepID=UPI00307B6584